MALDETSQFQYFRWEDKFATEVKPYYAMMDLPEGFARANFEAELGPTEIVTDIRHDLKAFSLDQNAFIVKSHVLKDQEFDQDAIRSGYLPQLEGLIKDELGQDCEVFFFDWRMRSTDSKKTHATPGGKTDLEDKSIVLQPVTSVHVDQSPFGARKRVLHHMGDRAPELLRGRVRIINTWRPIQNLVEVFPLAMLDGSTIPEGNLVTIDHIRRTYVGETQYARYSPEQRWYYLSAQTKDEVIMMKMYDSATDVKATCCPHAAFEQKRTIDDPKPRETIETRALVFTKS